MVIAYIIKNSKVDNKFFDLTQKVFGKSVDNIFDATIFRNKEIAEYWTHMRNCLGWTIKENEWIMVEMELNLTEVKEIPFKKKKHSYYEEIFSKFILNMR